MAFSFFFASLCKAYRRLSRKVAKAQRKRKGRKEEVDELRVAEKGCRHAEFQRLRSTY
jgi:hypothetical protein